MSELSDFSRVNYPNHNVVEEQGYFLRDNKNLFYALYKPAGESNVGAVLISPFAEEKIRTHRIYVSFARLLASLGVSVLHFDYYGDGDSEGNFEDALFDDRLKDINGAVEFLKSKTSITKTCYIGLRWGATLAALYAQQNPPDSLILWEPIIDVNKFFQNHLRSNIASQMILEGKVTKNRAVLVEELNQGKKISVEGYILAGQFFVEAIKNDLKEFKFSHDTNTLIVQIARNIEKTRLELDNLKEVFKNIEIKNVPAEFEWNKTERWNPAPSELFNATIKFLGDHGIL